MKVLSPVSMPTKEKKYRVESLAPILALIRQKKLPLIKHVQSTHYYGEHAGNDVEKFVEYPDRVEVHVLHESQGMFTLTDHFPLSSREAGFAWLKDRGYTTANVVTMEYDEFAYNDGIIGTYCIDGFLPSVILSYPPGHHDSVEKAFGLVDALVIETPYTAYLASLGTLRSLPLP